MGAVHVLNGQTVVVDAVQSDTGGEVDVVAGGGEASVAGLILVVSGQGQSIIGLAIAQLVHAVIVDLPGVEAHGLGGALHHDSLHIAGAVHEVQLSHVGSLVLVIAVGVGGAVVGALVDEDHVIAAGVGKGDSVDQDHIGGHIVVAGLGGNGQGLQSAGRLVHGGAAGNEVHIDLAARSLDLHIVGVVVQIDLVGTDGHVAVIPGQIVGQSAGGLGRIGAAGTAHHAGAVKHIIGAVVGGVVDLGVVATAVLLKGVQARKRGSKGTGRHGASPAGTKSSGVLAGGAVQLEVGDGAVVQGDGLGIVVGVPAVILHNTGDVVHVLDLGGAALVNTHHIAVLVQVDGVLAVVQVQGQGAHGHIGVVAGIHQGVQGEVSAVDGDLGLGAAVVVGDSAGDALRYGGVQNGLSIVHGHGQNSALGVGVGVEAGQLLGGVAVIHVIVGAADARLAQGLQSDGISSALVGVGAGQAVLDLLDGS